MYCNATGLLKYIWELQRKKKINLISGNNVCKFYANIFVNFVWKRNYWYNYIFQSRHILNKSSDINSKCRNHNRNSNDNIKYSELKPGSGLTNIFVCVCLHFSIIILTFCMYFVSHFTEKMYAWILHQHETWSQIWFTKVLLILWYICIYVYVIYTIIYIMY